MSKQTAEFWSDVMRGVIYTFVGLALLLFLFTGKFSFFKLVVIGLAGWIVYWIFRVEPKQPQQGKLGRMIENYYWKKAEEEIRAVETKETEVDKKEQIDSYYKKLLADWVETNGLETLTDDIKAVLLEEAKMAYDEGGWIEPK